MQKNGYYIGLMSGTSADGIDAALVEMQNQSIRLIDYISCKIEAKLQADLLQLNHQPQISLEQLCHLHKDTAQGFVDAVQTLLTKNKLNPVAIQAIGSHGQTIFHAPEIPMTLQIGHPAFIAKQTLITTAADFRVDDMALGGQGAPFAPAFHQALFSQPHDCFVVNIGGIANISFLPGLGNTQPLLGWDTGPGNALMDEVCQTKLNIAYDNKGTNARKGKIHKELLDNLLDHPFLYQSAPKSTGRDSFHMQWVEQCKQQLGIELSSQDLLATLCELTAITISQQIKSIEIEDNCPVWVCGGGAYNDHLIGRIQEHLENYQVASSSELAINPDAIEAMMCAWLAQKRLLEQTVPLSSVTGASRNAVLGGIWHP